MKRAILVSAGLLALFALCGTVLLVGIDILTHERIAANERAALQRKLDEVINFAKYDNDLASSEQQLMLDAEQSITVYTAWQTGEPVAAILHLTAPDGYSGAITLLVGINQDGTISNVRALQHKETPGLGDLIEIERSPWITQFNGKSLANPAAAEWRVQRDGGAFDSLTSATITSRAVVKAVYQALRIFAEQQDIIFQQEVSVKHANN